MRTICKTRVLLSLLTWVALFIGATTAFAAPAPMPAYSDLGTNYSALINLTGEGPVDWLQNGVTAAPTTVVHKAPGTSPALTQTIPADGTFVATSWFQTSWTDGQTGFASGTNQIHKIQGSSSPFIWTATVDPTGAKRLLKIWLRNSSGTSTMSAQIVHADTSTDAAVPVGIPVTTDWRGEVLITFSSAVATDVLKVTWTTNGTGGQAFSSGCAALGFAIANPNLYAYDDLNSPAGALVNSSSPTGYGWTAWMEQNNNSTVPGYEVRSANPLSYLNLATNGNYAVGGRAYEWAGHPLNTATFPAAVQNGAAPGTIGAPGSTVWISALVRPDGNNGNNVNLYFSHSTNYPPGNPRTGLGISGGNWEIYDTTGAVHTATTVPATKGTTYLIVLKYVFGTGITLYVNPPSLGGAAPATPSAVYSTGNDLSFGSLFWFPGNGNGSDGSLDEVRMGATFADVTPVQVPVAPVMTSVTPAAGTVLVGNLASTVAVTFSEPVQGLGSITINGVPTTVAPLGSGANKIWTWAVPVAAQPAIPGTYNVTLSKTGITESLSGTSLPLAADVVWSFTIVPAPPLVYAYDDLNFATGPLQGATSGAATGWSGAWIVQNDNAVVPGYEVRNATPLSYINLATSGNYASGGKDYLASCHRLNLAAFPAAVKSGSVIGVAGQVVWFSALVRADNNNSDYQLFLSNGGNWYDNLKSGLRINGGKWEIYDNNTGNISTPSAVTVVRGATYMIVLKYEFAASNIVSLYVNPPNLGGAAPATPNAVYTTTNNLSFNNMQWYPGGGPGDASLDEVRIGNSFAAVTPVVPVPPAPPLIVSTVPGNGSVFTGSALPGSVSVTFDRAVDGVGAITINGTVVGSPVVTNSYRTWSWPVPPSVNPNVPGTVINVALSKTGITEVLSGSNFPLAADYAFSYTFDPRQYKPTVALVSNGDLLDNHSAYTSFLLNDAYPTSLYTRSIQVEDMPGKYYNMTAATKSVLQSSADLVIVLPYQNPAAVSAPGQWNSLAVPMIVHKADTAAAWGWGNSQAGAEWRTDSWMAGILGGDPATFGAMIINSTTVATDPILANTLYFPNAFGAGLSVTRWWATGAPLTFQSLAVPNGQIPALSSTTPQVYWSGWGWIGNQTQPMAKWESGAAFNAGGTASARRFFQPMGPQAAADNVGSTEVATFFNPAVGAYDRGAKQVLRNALRWLMNPDAKPLPLSIKSTSPPANGSAGVLGPITVVFSKPVTGVLASDLTWNASSSGITFKNPTASPLITVTPQGAPPTDTWIFDGPWENNPALINQFQPINITLNALDSPGVSHIVAASGEGLGLTTWTWNYAWNPVPASVPSKLWTLYE